MSVNPIRKLTDLYGDPCSDDTGAGAEITYGYDISQATATWKVRYERRFDFLKDVLGRHYVDRLGLQRQEPAQHPDANNLWAVKAVRKDFGPIPRTFKDPDIAHRQESDWGVMPKYEYCLIQVLFSHLPFNPIWNHQDDHGKEWLRYTRWSGQAGTKTLELTPHQGRLYMVQGPGGSAPADPGRGLAAAGNTGILAIDQTSVKTLGITDLICEWYYVPDAYIHILQPSTPNEQKLYDQRRVPIMANIEGYPTDAARGYPQAALNQRSDTAIGKVNFTPFMGFEAGTLLMVNATKTPINQPPIEQHDQENVWNKALLWNVKFYFRYLNVPIGSHVLAAPDGRDLTTPVAANNLDPNDGAFIEAPDGSTYHLKGWNTSYYPPTGKFYLSRFRTNVRSNWDIVGALTGTAPPATYDTLVHDTYEFRNFFKGVYDTLLPNREGEVRNITITPP